MPSSHPGTTCLRRSIARLIARPITRPGHRQPERRLAERRLTGLAALAIVGLTACGGTDPVPAARVAGDIPAGMPGVRLVDSVALAENDTVFVGQPTDIAMRGDREICVADGFQAKVSCFDRRGEWTRSFGQKGRGPGELLKPSRLAFDGDSVLLVADDGAGKIERYDVATGSNIRPLKAPGSFPSMHLVGDTAWIGLRLPGNPRPAVALDIRTGGARPFGSYTELHRRSPKAALMYSAAYPVPSGDSLIFAVLAVDSLFKMDREGNVGRAVAVPVIRRHGSPPDLEQRLLAARTPGELARAASLLVQVDRFSDGSAILFHLDLDLADNSGLVTAATAFATIVTPGMDRACVDIPLHVGTANRPRFAVHNDTIFSLEQSTQGERSLTFLRSFVRDDANCRWQPLT